MTLVLGEARFDIGGGAPAPAAPQLHFALVMSSAGETKILTHHNIRYNGKAPCIGHGTPVDRALAEQLLQSIRDAGADSGNWLPPTLLYKSDAAFVWHAPAKIRPMYFRVGEARLALRVPWPSLIFIAQRNGELQLFAHKGEQRPAQATRLFHAPLANVHGDARMCWGSVDAPAFALASIEAFERAVFRTYFTHPNHDHAIRASGLGNADRTARLLRFWRELHESEARLFPEKALVPFGKTLGEICAA